MLPRTDSKLKTLDMEQLIMYETVGRWWTGLIGLNFLQDLAARYIAWVVTRKMRRIKRTLKISEDIRRRHPDWF